MDTVLLEMKEHIATITINRPKALNALSTEVLEDLNTALCNQKHICFDYHWSW